MDQVIGPYLKLDAVCEEWDPRSPEVAERVSRLITGLVPWAQPEHIGSTSAPGMAGKGIIDLAVPFDGEEQLRQMKDALAELGFQRQGGPDPWPEDRPMRVGAIEHEGKTYRLHVHVIAHDSPQMVSQREFRERLTNDAAFRDAYVAEKRAILEAGNTDSYDYAVAKSDWVDAALSGTIDPSNPETHR